MSDGTHERWSAEQRQILAQLAWHAIAEGLGCRLAETLSDRGAAAWLTEPAATFVTLHKDGDLRGCIGNLQAHCSLHDSVASNARSAAFSDPRFAGLRRSEWPGLTAEISVLTPMQPFAASDYRDLLSKLRAGVDGLYVRGAGRSATFLPAVWEDLPQPADFVAHLWRKAGLPPFAWPADIALHVYQADKIDCGSAPSLL